MKKIEDDITGLSVSKQRKYQIRKMREGRCIICAEEAYQETLLCSHHHYKRGTRQPGRNKSKPKKWLMLTKSTGSTPYPLFLTG